MAVAVVYVAALFVTILDTTIVHVTLPTLADEFGVGIDSIEWVVTAYLLSLAVFIPASGWIGDRVGMKTTLLSAIVVFTVASGLCGLAQNVGQLVAFRVLQGVGGGLLTPVGLAMLFRAFPPERRAAASRILIIPTAVAPALGPVLGGLLIEVASWRWVFFVNVPIGIAVAVYGKRFLTEHREPEPGRFDLPGFVLAGIGFASLVFALSEGPREGWTAPVTVVAGTIAVVALVVLVVVELRTPRPMLAIRLFTNRLFRATNVVSGFGSAAFLGVLFLMPLMLQEARGASAFESGLTTFPEALGVLSCSQLVARLYPRFGPRVLMATGMTTMVGWLLLLSRVGLETSDWWIRGLMFLLGTAYSFLIIPTQAASFATISPADTGRASALYNTQRQVSQALGVAVLATTLAAALPDAGPTGLSAYQSALVVAAAFAAAAAVAAVFVPTADARETMSVRRRPRPT